MGRRKPKKRTPYVTVEAGQVYQVPCEGKPTKHVRVLRVLGPNTQQPKARYILITKSGNLKERRHPEEQLNVCWLSFRDHSWRMPPGFEQVVDGQHG